MAGPANAFSRMTGVGWGITWISVSILVAVCMDTMSKYLAQIYPVTQVVWARYIFQAGLVLLILAPRLAVLARTQRMGMQLLRSSILLLASLFFVLGLKHVPLADASAILFLAPLIVTVLSVPLLGEKVGLRRWIAVLVGLTGALAIVRPGAGVFQTAALYPVMTAVLYAFYMLSTRHLSRTDSAITTLIYTASVGAVVMSVAVPFVWVPPDPADWGLMVLLGSLGAACHFAIILAFQAAPAPVVAPFEYSRLAWAALLGFFVFGDLPDHWTVLGALLIVGSGVYVF
ncbi:MAG: DMT family transporter, partial [Rhodospirillales bacterium]|nr:DMT family transporter [Rhodospirillales bacterium]